MITFRTILHVRGAATFHLHYFDNINISQQEFDFKRSISYFVICLDKCYSADLGKSPLFIKNALSVTFFFIAVILLLINSF